MVPWKGGPCPVDADRIVVVNYRDGSLSPALRASKFHWNHVEDTPTSDIVAYCVADTHDGKTNMQRAIERINAVSAEQDHAMRCELLATIEKAKKQVIAKAVSAFVQLYYLGPAERADLATVIDAAINDLATNLLASMTKKV